MTTVENKIQQLIVNFKESPDLKQQESRDDSFTLENGHAMDSVLTDLNVNGTDIDDVGMLEAGEVPNGISDSERRNGNDLRKELGSPVAESLLSGCGLRDAEIEACSSLGSDLLDLFLNQKGTDVTLKIKDKEVKAHR